MIPSASSTAVLTHESGSGKKLSIKFAIIHIFSVCTIVYLLAIIVPTASNVFITQGRNFDHMSELALNT